MSVKVDTRGLDKKLKALGKLVGTDLRKDIKNDMGKLAVDTIYNRVKSGYGVSDDKSSEPKKDRLKPLSKNYKQYRNGKAAWFTNKTTKKVFKTTKSSFVKKPKLGEFGKPNKSNLTLSGDMLNNITYKIKRFGVRIFIKGKKNKQKAEWASKGDTKRNRPPRPFLGLTSAEQKIIKTSIRNKIRSLLKKLT